ncbi:MAG: methyltransferase domain-containing protein [Parasporobacterium sp.]|nr:methyltransferase domain-containing protein [Parasporobacterium sp.]
MSKESEAQSTRNIVLSMLTATLDEGAFSHLVRNQTLKGLEIDPRDLLFIERLFHGTLEQVIFLDWIISSYSSIKIAKMKPVIRNILRMSIYQMLFMDSVPDHAAINEAVKLTRTRGYRGLSPFVNGLLRSFQRGGVKPGMPRNVKYSAPLWLYDKMVCELGQEKAEAFFDSACQPKNEIYARLSTFRAPAEDIIRMLQIDGCEVFPVPNVPEAVKLKKAQKLTELNAFRQGLVFVQDLNSIRVGRIAAELAKPLRRESEAGEEITVSKEDFSENVPVPPVTQIIDVCAAPGGKSLHLADLFPKAEVIARDLSQNKVDLIEENIQRSQSKNVRVEVHDALVFDETLAGKADIVLADLPCSGIGVIGRKPDIKLRLKEEDLKELAELQQKILDVVSGYVREGGLLIFSTCTINRTENQDNAEWFLENHSFVKIEEKQFLPGQDEGDGFYIAAFRKTDALLADKE